LKINRWICSMKTLVILPAAALAIYGGMQAALKNSKGMPIAGVKDSLENHSEMITIYGNDICTDKALDDADQITLNAVVKAVGATDCQEAVRRVTTKKELSLQNLGLTSTRVLGSFPTLETLYLEGNAISEVKGLDRLPRLRSLHLAQNKLKDVHSIAPLTKLEALFLTGNEIREVGSLAQLKELRILHLGGNLIRDVGPLGVNPALKQLWLHGNQIESFPSGAGFLKLTHLGVSANRIADLAPLASLPTLSFVDASENALSPLQCKKLRQTMLCRT
jgi:hypothetical protein